MVLMVVMVWIGKGVGVIKGVIKGLKGVAREGETAEMLLLCCC